jgi:hypothetical protein
MQAREQSTRQIILSHHKTRPKRKNIVSAEGRNNDDRNQHRASLDRKLHVLRDVVTAVAKGFKYGLYLHGDGGVGKSYTVLRRLAELQVGHQLFNSRISAKGLFLALQRYPDLIHVFEDVERLTKEHDAQGVLRSALWSPPGHPRLVTWTTAADGAQRFEFRGGVIMISNRPLADLPELRALATRIEVFRLDVNDAELTTLMLDLAQQGFCQNDKRVINPEDCLQITEHLLSECRAAGCRLDLRLQQKSFQTFLQWEADWTTSHWRDLVAVGVREAAGHFRHESNIMPREDRRTWRRNVLREILAQTSDAKEQEKRYRERTSCSRPDFFRRKNEIVSGEFDEQDMPNAR